MGNPRCRVYDCRKDAIPGTDYCEQHTIKKRKPGRPGYREIYSEVLEQGSHDTYANRPIRELAKINATQEEIEMIKRVYEKRNRDLRKEYGKACKMYDEYGTLKDIVAKHNLKDEIRINKTSLKKLTKIETYLKKDNMEQEYVVEKPPKEKYQREHALEQSSRILSKHYKQKISKYPKEKVIDKTKWHDTGDVDIQGIIKAEQEKKKKKFEEYSKEERLKKWKKWGDKDGECNY